MKHIKQTPKATENDTFQQSEQIPQCHSEASYSVFKRRSIQLLLGEHIDVDGVDVGMT